MPKISKSLTNKYCFCFSPLRELPPPYREFAHNSNTKSTHLDPQILVTEIVTKFSEIVMFYLHIENQCNLYLTSIRRLIWLPPDLLRMEEETTANQFCNKRSMLSIRLRSNLQKICDGRNIELDANKWFECVCRNVLHFSSSFNIRKLLEVLRMFLQDQSEYYLSIPFLTKIFKSVMNTLAFVIRRQEWGNYFHHLP